MINFINVGNGDAILIQSGDCNLLVDGGLERNIITNKRLKTEVENLIKEGCEIDLLIVTHSDDDHIGGILNLVDDDNIEKHIKKYIFHSEKHIAEYLKQKYQRIEEYELKPQVSKPSMKSGYLQDKRLTDKLESTPEKWDKKIYFSNETLSIGDSTITILSPTEEKIKKLQSYWEKEKKEILKKSSKRKDLNKSSKRKDFDYSTKFKDFDFSDLGSDTSATNGASIALIFDTIEENTQKPYKALFLADSHPSIIADSLKKLLGENESRLHFDIVKLSHHGSKKNITRNLLELIDCQNFVVSANANLVHKHPDKETLALIIDHYGQDNVNLFFTDENNQIKEIFKGEKFKNYFFPSNNSNKLKIPYAE